MNVKDVKQTKYVGYTFKKFAPSTHQTQKLPKAIKRVDKKYATTDRCRRSGNLFYTSKVYKIYDKTTRI